MAKIIDGKALAQGLREDLKEKIEALDKKPVLAVILVGENEASKIYVRNKQKAAAEVGIVSELLLMPSNTTDAELRKVIIDLNNNSNVDGILLQLPLPKHIDALEMLKLIAFEKDVDGFSPHNAGLLSMNLPEAMIAATPKGVLHMLKSVCPDLVGKHVVIIGRSNIVGRPLSNLLLNQDCTVTITHSKTVGIEALVKQGDIVVAACGCPRLVKKSWVKQGAVVIDVGINRLENGKICGDVDFEDVSTVASYISPVPGGVGPMTIAALLSNTYEAAKRRSK